MKKILAVLIVLFMVASCLFVAGTVAAKDKQGGHGGKKVVGDELRDIEDLSDMGDFSTGGIEGKQKVKRAEAEGIPLQSPEEFGMTQLTDDDVDSIHPMFSPDGRKIAYMNRSWEKEYRSEIWVMNADGSNKYNVTDADAQCAHLEGWSPDGTKLLFRSYEEDAPATDTTTHEFTGTPPPTDNGTLNVSIRGDFGQSNEYANVYVEGDYIGRVGPTGSDCNVDWFSVVFDITQTQINTWNADGKIVVTVVNSGQVDYFCCYNQHRVNLTYDTYSQTSTISYYDPLSVANNNLWLANADGSGVTQITFEANRTCFGGWDSINKVATDFSPDGSKIAFKKCYRECDPDGGGWRWRQPDLWVMDANGANQVQLTNTPDNSEQYPKWSPDGSKILYKRCNSHESPSDLWVINADGSNPHVVVAGAGPTAFSWSSDGEWIVWSSSRFGREEDFIGDLEDGDRNSDIYRVRADGTGLAMLTSGDTECQQDALVFGAGCRDVIMYRDRSYGNALWVMSLHGALATQVSPSWVGEKAYDHSPNGEWLVFQRCEWDEEWNTNEDWHTVIYTAKNPLYCPTEVPTLMPVGLIALVGLLSVIAAVSIIRRKRKG